LADAVAKWLETERRATVVVERAIWNDAPFRTTLATTRPQPAVLVEVQGRFQYHTAVAALAAWMMARRFYAELYLAVDADAEVPGHALEQMKRDGVGLLLRMPAGEIVVTEFARNPALIVHPDPTLVFGECETDIKAAIRKFNYVDRKDGLRDMCAIVERETERLAVVASRKKLVQVDETILSGMDWSTQINTLASKKAAAQGVEPLLDENAKNDFHSFRGARNLVDHPAPNRRQDAKRAKQFSERMTQGPRLVAELVSLRRRISRKPRRSP
jgi:hypothetical protein